MAKSRRNPRTAKRQKQSGAARPTCPPDDAEVRTNSTPLQAHFPPEIFTMISEYLSTRDASAMSLVCRAMRPATERAVFRTFSMTGTLSDMKADMDEFMKHPRWAKYVKHLYMPALAPYRKEYLEELTGLDTALNGFRWALVGLLKNTVNLTKITFLESSPVFLERQLLTDQYGKLFNLESFLPKTGGFTFRLNAYHSRTPYPKWAPWTETDAPLHNDTITEVVYHARLDMAHMAMSEQALRRLWPNVRTAEVADIVLYHALHGRRLERLSLLGEAASYLTVIPWADTLRHFSLLARGLASLRSNSLAFHVLRQHSVKLRSLSFWVMSMDDAYEHIRKLADFSTLETLILKHDGTWILGSQFFLRKVLKTCPSVRRIGYLTRAPDSVGKKCERWACSGRSERGKVAFLGYDVLDEDSWRTLE